MPTILSFNGIKIKVNAKDHPPPHVHVEGCGGKARYNLKTKSWIESKGFSKRDLLGIETQITNDFLVIMEAWNEHHEK